MTQSSHDTTTTQPTCARSRLATASAILLVTGGLLLTPAAGAEQCQQYPNVCQQEYALCIAASCMYEPNGSHALCVCDVEVGWSIGGDSCAERAPVDQGRYTTLVSTFSAALYDSQPFHQGSGINADCYDAPCVSTDGELAVCRCRVSQEAGEYWTEAGSCSEPGKNIVYSGASSPFAGGGLADLAERIATCSGVAAPTPTSCP